MSSTIHYTWTDEAPFFATQSFLPIIKAFVGRGNIAVKTVDISLAGRILSCFSNDHEDGLKMLGRLVHEPHANIIKLPNISASVPQLKEAVKELQSQGFNIPDYPAGENGGSERRKKYQKILGSAVNPVLRIGNSDRRVAAAVKNYAKENPHFMGEWKKNSKTHVASMESGDFYSSEQSVLVEQINSFRIELVTEKGDIEILKEETPLQEGDIIDSSVMKSKALREFFEKEIKEAREQDLLLSLHLKTTMMKVSDPIIFGHALQVYFQDALGEYQKEIKDLGHKAKDGLGDLYSRLASLKEDATREKIKKAFDACFAKGPSIAMADVERGITNFHVPSDFIIDASMPACIRHSGKMYDAAGELRDTKALIPDRTYSGIYQEVIDFCKEHGAFNPQTMGNVSNVGLMAKKAEEYGSHDKTFELHQKGIIRVVDSQGQSFMEHKVDKGDIFRMCQTKIEAVIDWAKVGMARAKATGHPLVYWLDKERPHDRHLIETVNFYLSQEKTEGLHMAVLSPREAMRYTLDRLQKGEDTISATGNVLRDYLTDLFPILELGTSAKMLSIVQLLQGGGLFETGAGGTAPKHVRQFLDENHLRWDSLGEFLALSISLHDLGEKFQNPKALVLGDALDKANEAYLNNRRSPSRKVGEPDIRSGHYYLALYWAKALKESDEDEHLRKSFSALYEDLEKNRDKILDELNQAQGRSVDIGGYYRPCLEKSERAMRPSETLNKIIDGFMDGGI